MSISFSLLELNGQEKKKKTTQKHGCGCSWLRLFVEVYPIPTSLILAEKKSFYSSAFLTTFIHSTPIQHPWVKWLHYELLIYVTWKKISKAKNVSVHFLLPLRWGDCHERAEDSSKMIETSHQPKLMLCFSCSLWRFHYCHFLHESFI